MRKHPADVDAQDLDCYAERDDEGLEELGTPVEQGSGLSVGALLARRWVAGSPGGCGEHFRPLAGGRPGCGADGLSGPVPGGLQGAAGGGRERPVGQGGKHGADPEAGVLHPGGHIAHLSHA
jgi:hypothetical protein